MKRLALLFTAFALAIAPAHAELLVCPKVPTANAVSHQWISAISASSQVTQSQPAFTDISGVATAAQGGTGISTSSSTGVAQVSSGIWSVGTTLQNAVQDNITRLGIVTSGTWNATAVGAQYGGTGLNTSASTGVPSISSGTWSVAAQLASSKGGTGADLSGSTGYPSIAAGVWTVASATNTFITLYETVTSALGDLVYGGASGTPTRLAGSTSATMAVLTQTGNGSVSAAPAWTTTSGSGSVVRAGSPALTGAPTFAGSSTGTTAVQASATASGTLTLPAATDTLVGKATTDTLTNKTISTGGTNVIGATTISGTTGSTNVVFSASPTFSGTTTFPSSTSVDSSGHLGVNGSAGSFNMFVGTAASGNAVVLRETGATNNVGLFIETNEASQYVKLQAGATTSSSLKVQGSGGSGQTIDSSGNTTFDAGMVNTHLSTGTNADFLCLKSDGTFLIQASACTISSRRFKENINSLTEDDGLKTVMALRPVEFNMKPGDHPNPDHANYGRTQVGLIAEDVEAVDPRLALYEDDGKTPKSYRQESIIAELIKAVQQQQHEIVELKRELRARK